MSRPLCNWLILSFLAAPGFAQVESDVQRDLPSAAFSTTLSSLFTASQGDIIAVRVSGPVQLNIEVSVYNRAHMLVSKDDPEKPVSEFRYVVAESGSYYVLGRNLTAVDGTLSVFIQEGARAETAKGQPLAVVRVFYGTNRTPAKQVNQSPYYLNEISRGTDTSLGFCDVRIPRNHKLGELESAATFRLGMFADQGTDIRVINLIPATDRKTFYDAIRDKASHTSEKQVLVFIHGFNVSFEDAARRTAQISYDLGFAGAPVLFSWPSNASPIAYKDDQLRVDATVEVLQRFLRDLSVETGTTNIQIIAHSMGNRLLLKALEGLSRDQSPPRLRSAIMVAPDVDATTLEALSGAIHRTVSRLTMYTSTADLALRLSEWSSGVARAGNHIVYSTDLQTIDASAANTELTSWSHSYFADSPLVLGDLFHLLRGEPPDMRFALDRVCKDEGCITGQIYWKFRPSVR